MTWGEIEEGDLITGKTTSGEPLPTLLVVKSERHASGQLVAFLNIRDPDRGTTETGYHADQEINSYISVYRAGKKLQ